jgi:hypothetical protein
MLGLGIYFLIVDEQQQLTGIALATVGLVETTLATFVPKIIANRVAESQRKPSR